MGMPRSWNLTLMNWLYSVSKGAPLNGYDYIFVPKSEDFFTRFLQNFKGLVLTFFKTRVASRPISIITAIAYQEPHFMPYLLR